MTTDIFAMSVPSDACIMAAGCKNSAVMSFLQASFITDGLNYPVQQAPMLQAAEPSATQYVASTPIDRGTGRG